MLKAYIYYYLKEHFSDNDVKKVIKELPEYEIEQTTKDELIIKADTTFENLYTLSKSLTKRIKELLNPKVNLNRIITFRDM